MNRKKSYRSATLGDALLKPAYELEKLKTKKLEEKNMELEMLVKRLTTERDKALELATQAERSVTNHALTIDVLSEELRCKKEELQRLREHNDTLGKNLIELVDMQRQYCLPKQAETALIDYPKTDLDAKVIARQYDPDSLKNAIGTLTASTKWYRKDWYILFRFLSDHKVLVPGCTKADFARWVEATFPDAGKHLANAMKQIDDHCKKCNMELWLEDAEVHENYKNVLRRIIEQFTYGWGLMRTEFRAYLYL